MSQVEALKKELARVRSKSRILEACLDLGCRVWFDVDLGRHPYPQSLPLAFSYRAVGEGEKFVVLGSDQANIEKMAQIYSRERFGEGAIEPSALDQSKIGFMFEEHGRVWEVAAPSLYESDWIVTDSSCHSRRYLSNGDLATKKEISLTD